MLVHNPPFQGGIVQYCVLLCNELKNFVNLDTVGFKRLYPPLLYKGKLPKKNRSGIQFKVPNHNFITWYNPFGWIRAYLKLREGDIIHLQWVSPLLTPLQYVILKLNKWFAKKPVVLTCHNIEPHESTIFDKAFTKAIFSMSDHFVVHAKQNTERLLNDYGKRASNVHMIPHGTFGYFTKWSKESQKELKKKLGWDGKKIVLFFGYIREYKGLRYLIRAMPEVIHRHPDARLLIAGELWQKWDAYEKEIDKANKRLKKILSKSGKNTRKEGIDADLRNYVKVIPKFIPDKEVHKLFDAADLTVLPYHNTEQTISGPLFVSLAFGKPTIVSPVGGITEFIKDGKNGMISPGGDVKSLVRNINKVLADGSLRVRLGKEAKRTNEHHTWDKIAKEYYEVYKTARNMRERK